MLFSKKLLRFSFLRPVTILVVLAVSALPPLIAQKTPHQQVGVQIIVVPSTKEAQQVVDRLNAGEDFGTVAKQKSTDATAEDGGYLGKVDPSTLRSELRDAIAGLEPGKLSAIVKLPSGFAVLKVLPAGESPVPANPTPTRILPLAATGSIRYPPNVGGKGEADLAFRSFSKPSGWSQDLQALCKIRKDSLAAVTDQLNSSLTLAGEGGPPPGSALDRIETRYALANLYAYQGIMDKSVTEWEAAYQIAKAELPAAMPELEEVLGIAYLHKSEMDNDVYRHPGDRCIFPPTSTVRYEKPGDSEKAIEYLTRYLERKPEAQDAKWLLNLAYMTLGKYPAGVPQNYLIPPSTFDSRKTSLASAMSRP